MNSNTLDQILNSVNIKKLKDAVELVLGQELEIREGITSIGANETMVSKIESGVPVIIYNKDESPDEEDIYHELAHLHIKCQNGIHDITLEGPLVQFLRNKYKDPSLLLTKAHSIFHHSYFFSEMINLGYTPGSKLERQFSATTSYPGGYVQEDLIEHVALDYWNLKNGGSAPTSNADSMLDEIEGKCIEGSKLGNSCYQIACEFVQPDQELDVFNRLISTLFAYESSVQFKMEGNTGVYY